MARLPPNFFDLCRMCKMSTTIDRQTIFNEEVSSFFEKYPSLSSADPKNDTLPRVVCQTCFQVMDYVKKFVARAEKVKLELEQVAKGMPVEFEEKPASKRAQSVSETPSSPLGERDGRTISVKIPYFEYQAGLENGKNYFICAFCRIIFQSIEEAAVHTLNHKKKNHSCSMCNLRFNTSTLLSQHVELGEHCPKVEAWTCSSCPFFHEKWSEVKSHMSMKHKRCLECNLFWRDSIEKAKTVVFNHTKLCETCGKLVSFKSVNSHSKLLEEAELLEEGILDVCEIMKHGDRDGSIDASSIIGIKKELTEEEEEAQPMEIPILPPIVQLKKPRPDKKEIRIVLERLSPRVLKQALRDIVKIETCDEASTSEQPDHLPELNEPAPFENRPLMENPSESSEVVTPLQEKLNFNEENKSECAESVIVTRSPNKKKVTSYNLLCKYCPETFNDQLEYIMHIRNVHK